MLQLSSVDIHSRRGAVHMNWQKYYIHHLETHLLECGDDSHDASSSDTEDEGKVFNFFNEHATTPDTTNEPSTSESTADAGHERYIEKAYRFANKALEHVQPGTRYDFE